MFCIITCISSAYLSNQWELFTHFFELFFSCQGDFFNKNINGRRANIYLFHYNLHFCVIWTTYSVISKNSIFFANTTSCLRIQTHENIFLIIQLHTNLHICIIKTVPFCARFWIVCKSLLVLVLTLYYVLLELCKNQINLGIKIKLNMN